ncbi:UNVERIFIED_CONTAM: hypothetical protein K2H54_002352 [Gekko kuhli]
MEAKKPKVQVMTSSLQRPTPQQEYTPGMEVISEDKRGRVSTLDVAELSHEILSSQLVSRSSPVGRNGLALVKGDRSGVKISKREEQDRLYIRRIQLGSLPKRSIFHYISQEQADWGEERRLTYVRLEDKLVVPALIDSGADMSSISEALFHVLGLKADGKVDIYTYDRQAQEQPMTTATVAVRGWSERVPLLVHKTSDLQFLVGMDIQFKMAKRKGIRVQQQPVFTRSKTKACLATPSEPNVEMCLPYETQLIHRTGIGGKEDTILAGMSTEQEENKLVGREVADGIILDWSAQALKDHLHSCITLQECREKAKDVNQSISKPGDS